MRSSKQTYLAYWKQLKLFIDESGLAWRFYSFEGEAEAVVKIGTPHHKICLSLVGADSRNPRPSIAASFWIPDSREDFELLRGKRAEIEVEAGKPLVWDCKHGRKSCWIRLMTAMDLSQEKNWPASFEWFAENAQKLRDVCHRHLI
ncbi:MAG: DUF4268 domain-containing protein [Candidatus Omnitrophica bacterium]|nr:DUF4268 domain-containing protein [Candidatus Omnitrophota bacterium]